MGSLPTAKTMGIFVVAAFAASAAGVLPGVAITVTFWRIKSAASLATERLDPRPNDIRSRRSGPR